VPVNLRERCLWLNRAIDRRKQRLPAAMLETYARHLRDKARSPETRVRDADSEWQTSNEGTALCCGSRCAEPLSSPLAHVMKLSAFVVHHTNKPINDRIEQTFLDWMEDNPEEVRACQRGVLRGKRNHCWLTWRQALLDQLAKLPREAWADFARGELALRISRNVPLVCILFPEGYFSSANVPTFIDGGSNELFCAWVDESREVGFTWSLVTDKCGLPEMVTKDGELTPGAEVIYLNTTRSAQPRPRYKQRLRRLRAQLRDAR